MSVIIDGTGTIAASQLKFPAIQSPSSDPNTIDDYKEGTWTPVITDSDGHSCTMGTDNSGFYVKIGRLVTIGATINWTSKAALTVPSSRIRIGGLPYPAITGLNIRVGVNFGPSISGSFSIEREEIAFGIDPGLNYVWGTYISGTNIDGSMIPAHLGSSGTLFGFSCTYIAD